MEKLNLVMGAGACHPFVRGLRALRRGVRVAPTRRSILSTAWVSWFEPGRTANRRPMFTFGRVFLRSGSIAVVASSAARYLPQAYNLLRR